MDGDDGRRAAEVFAELADTLTSDFDIMDFLQVLVERSVEVLRVDVAGVTLEGRDGLALAAGSSEQMRVLEEWEARHDQGPCRDAYHGVKQILVADLREATDRWPDFTPKALDIGMRGVHAFPLRLRDDCIGGMNLYRERPGELSDDAVRLGQAFADMATIGILQQRKLTTAERLNDQLAFALQSRVVIEQAKGVVAERYGVTPDEAFQEIRRFARRHRSKLHDVARAILHGTQIRDDRPDGDGDTA